MHKHKKSLDQGEYECISERIKRPPVRENISSIFLLHTTIKILEIPGDNLIADFELFIYDKCYGFGEKDNF